MPAAEGVSHADPRFLNDLLNSSYIASLYDPDLGLAQQHLGQLIVAAHGQRPADVITEATVDAILLEGDIHDIRTTLDRIDRMDPAPQSPPTLSFHGNASQSSVDHTVTHNIPSTTYAATPRTYEDTELELLKIAVTNPDLYNNLKEVFENHRYPEKLDPVGQMLRQYFISNRDKT